MPTGANYRMAALSISESASSEPFRRWIGAPRRAHPPPERNEVYFLVVPVAFLAGTALVAVVFLAAVALVAVVVFLAGAAALVAVVVFLAAGALVAVVLAGA